MPRQKNTVIGPPEKGLMKMSLLSYLTAIAFLISLSTGQAAERDDSSREPSTSQKQIAFPGAEGFGRFAQGGRGGDVYHVTNLNDAGAGSLRDGVLSAKGPRTIVFDVSGTIELKTPLLIEKSFLTIAGQTAPGDGICLKDQTFRIRRASHIIVRYIRVRLGDENKPRPSGPDCMNTDDVDHVIFDHITASWGIDGNHDLRRGGNFTVQWSIYAEALNNSLHEDGKPRDAGIVPGSDRLNLAASQSLCQQPRTTSNTWWEPKNQTRRRRRLPKQRHL
jgi:hypothetical protein